MCTQAEILFLRVSKWYMTSQVRNTHVFVLMFEDEDSHAFEALVDAIATSFLNHVLHALQKKIEQ